MTGKNRERKEVMDNKLTSDLPKPKEEEIIVDGCTCGKSKLLMVKQEYYSSDTSDDKRRGSMRDYGLAWVCLLDGYILEIDGINNTLPYRRSSTSIVKRTPLTKDQEADRKRRLEYLAIGHPGLYEAIRIIAKKEKIEPIKVPLKRLDMQSKKKRLDGLRQEKERKLRDITHLNELIHQNLTRIEEIEED